jgi:hypothetical protein
MRAFSSLPPSKDSAFTITKIPQKSKSQWALFATERTGIADKKLEMAD